MNAMPLGFDSKCYACFCVILNLLSKTFRKMLLYSVILRFRHFMVQLIPQAKLEGLGEEGQEEPWGGRMDMLWFIEPKTQEF